MSGVVRTVLGDIDATTLGIVDAHDHVLIRASWGTFREPELLLSSPDEAREELNAFARNGGGTVVDCMPSACGRDAAGLAEASRLSGVNVVATAGYHLSTYYPPWHWYHEVDEAKLSAIVRAEVAEGFDLNDNNGPDLIRSSIRPGQLKVAAGFHRMSLAESRAMSAVAAVQIESGLPLAVHIESGADPHRPLDLLHRLGVAPDAIVLAHMDRNPDWTLHAEVMERGAWLSYDGMYRERTRPVSAVIECLSRASSQISRILVGGDVARSPQRLAKGGSGIAGLVGAFRSRVARELGADITTQVFVRNPAIFFSLRTTSN